MSLLEFAFTPRACELLHPVNFGLLVAHDVDVPRLADRLQPIRKETQRSLAVPPPSGVSDNLVAFDAYFRTNKHESPLLAQRAHFQKSGIPRANPFVTLLLIAELRTGVLVGIQDATAICQPVRFDIAGEAESFEGMRDIVRCRADEPVLRDASGIIASLFQGPDKRTRVSNESRDIAAFVFSVPDRPQTSAETVIGELESMLAPACGLIERAVFSSEAQR